MQFGAVSDIYMAKKKDEILIAFVVNQRDYRYSSRPFKIRFFNIGCNYNSQ